MKKTFRILAVIFALILIIPTTVFAKDGDMRFEPVGFIDVKESAWFYDAVMYVNNEGLMLGVNETSFAPKQNITRAQLVTILPTSSVLLRRKVPRVCTVSSRAVLS